MEPDLYVEACAEGFPVAAVKFLHHNRLATLGQLHSRHENRHSLARQVIQQQGMNMSIIRGAVSWNILQQLILKTRSCHVSQRWSNDVSQPNMTAWPMTWSPGKHDWVGWRCRWMMWTQDDMPLGGMQAAHLLCCSWVAFLQQVQQHQQFVLQNMTTQHNKMTVEMHASHAHAEGRLITVSGECKCDSLSSYLGAPVLKTGLKAADTL